MNEFEFDDETIIQQFGTEAAEDEDFTRLQSYYVKNKTHRNLTSNLPIRLLVGHKGIGKSAIFQIAHNEDCSLNKVSIIIHPDDVSQLGVEVEDFRQMIRDWKEGLIEIIASKVLENLGIQMDNEVIQAGVRGVGRIVNFLTQVFKIKINENVNLQPANKEIIARFLVDQNIIVYIDDLDRGWEGNKQDIQRVSALLNAIRDLCNANKGLKFRVSLRADAYYLVRTSDESTDKVENYVVWHNWTNFDILLMLIKRIEAFFDREFNPKDYRGVSFEELAKFLDPIFSPTFEGVGKWCNAPTYKILISLIRKRPRDLVKLCSLAAKNAYDKDSAIISTENLKAVFSEYSQGRLQDTINEYRSELPDIERLLLGMKPNRTEVKENTGWIYSTADLRNKIFNIIQGGEFYFKNGSKATEKTLAQFMYKINFLTARKTLKNGTIARAYFEDKQYIASTVADFGFEWEIHPAFRWALSPEDDDKPTTQIDLSDEG